MAVWYIDLILPLACISRFVPYVRTHFEICAQLLLFIFSSRLFDVHENTSAFSRIQIYTVYINSSKIFIGDDVAIVTLRMSTMRCLAKETNVHKMCSLCYSCSFFSLIFISSKIGRRLCVCECVSQSIDITVVAPYHFISHIHYVFPIPCLHGQMKNQ